MFTGIKALWAILRGYLSYVAPTVGWLALAGGLGAGLWAGYNYAKESYLWWHTPANGAAAEAISAT